MIARSFIDRQARFIVFLALAAALAGVIASFSLPVALFPQVSFPRIVVNIDAGDRPAEQMETEVTRPVEQALREIQGVGEIRSTTSRGSADVSLNFAWGTDMVSTLLQADAALTQVLPSLPAGTSFRARRMDPTVFPIIAYSLISANVPPDQLRDLALYQLAPMLSGITGVRRVDVVGGRTAEYQVLIDPARLAARGLTIEAVSQAIAGSYALAAIGRVEDHYKLSLIFADASLKDVDAIRQIVLTANGGAVVQLKDIAEVTAGAVPQWTRVMADGKDAVLFQVYQQPGGNSVRIAKDVRDALVQFAMPAGVTLANWYDQSELVTQSAASVRDAILIGVVLSALVLVVFLRNWRLTVIAIAVVPATLAITTLILTIAGMSFNIMTLGGLAAAVGLIIDDVIVMLEHIVRRRQAGSEDVLGASREFRVPLTGSSLATCVVFLPLAFLSGVTGAFFKALSLTMVSALAVSYLLALMVVPLVTRRMLRLHFNADHGVNSGFARSHRRLLERLFRRPVFLAAGFLPVAVIGVLAILHVGTGFMPHMDEGGFVLDYHAAPGTSLAETDRILRQVETILGKMPEVQTISRRTGFGLGGTEIDEANKGDFFVHLKPRPRRGIDAVMADTRQQIESQVPGLTIELAQLMEDLIGDLTAVPQPIEIKLAARDPTVLSPAARQVADAIGKVDGVVGIDTGVIPAGNAIDVTIDPVKASLLGLKADALTQTLRGYLTGAVAVSVPYGPKEVGIRVRIAPSFLHRQDQLADLPLRTPDGKLVPLSQVATFSTIEGQPQITRDNLQQIVAVTARIEGRDLGSAAGDVKQVLDRPDFLPKGVTYTLGGLYQQQQTAFRGMLAVFGAAAAAEFALLLSLYESFAIAGVVLATSLCSSLAVFIGLWITGIELNITALMGLTMIIGIGAEISIFYVSEFRSLAATKPLRQALVEASGNRLRPIGMTTLAAILTLLPLALALGPGSEMQQPLAIAIISGLCLQFPLVVLALPVLLGLALRGDRVSDSLPRSQGVLS